MIRILGLDIRKKRNEKSLELNNDIIIKFDGDNQHYQKTYLNSKLN